MITKLYVKTSMFLSQFKNDERGVTAIEYGLIGVAMAVLLAAALNSTGFIGELKTAFAKIASTIDTSTGT
ncbi:Flp family type IVb pilin [Vibrio splendidus]|uniref:Flp family type IVb pilin n=1 Tax=Vibrio splendidus TaxID=29497 RepID=UPI000C86363D|nr:Flp family type IVb pilin [Vibrio splendidus]PMO92091.1 pilus assembly protein [Vibrio splendidus]PMP19010.1 pilus assembly protein [Vibrio splendidus]PMP34801.1 pilus assembly protein [Vibrio splendidus]PMP36379.1 pilus assembly protein [Vibrio splendidus]PMP47426.1 pilus assembly protein [Vibrio splendidus]